MALADVRVVLVSPQGAANVGSVARAMKNMGLAELVLAGPARLDAEAARSMAVHARDVLAAARTVPSLADAVADCVHVAGTAARPGHFRGQVHTPRQAATELLRHARRGPVALVFGPEDHGLSNRDFEQCHSLVTIPAAAAYASLNLAQAVLVCAYELHLAAAPTNGASSGVLATVNDEEAEPRPSAAQLALMLAKLEQALLACGFLNPQNPHAVMNVFRRIFARAELREHDVQVLFGLARQVRWLADQVPAPTPSADPLGRGPS